jgi:hypothetical protein
MPEIQAVVSKAERFAQMQEAIDTGLPFLKKATERHKGTLSIVGYGPSLADTWQSIPHPMIATSGAYDYLLDRGTLPEYYIAIDPRSRAVDLLQHPHTATTYLMASVCHPRFWQRLKEHDVELWHLINGEDGVVEWVTKHHPAGLGSLIGGGSTVGQRAFNVGAALGYHKFNVFGMDCSFWHNRHAGPHTGQQQPEIKIPCGGRIFKTTPQLLQSARELAEFLVTTTDVEAEFYGDGLLQEMVRQMKRKRKSYER